MPQYRERNLIERFFTELKQFRRVVIPYNRLAANFLVVVRLASIRLWLRAHEYAPWLRMGPVSCRSAVVWLRKEGAPFSFPAKRVEPSLVGPLEFVRGVKQGNWPAAKRLRGCHLRVACWQDGQRPDVDGSEHQEMPDPGEASLRFEQLDLRTDRSATCFPFKRGVRARRTGNGRCLNVWLPGRPISDVNQHGPDRFDRCLDG